jgi:hypothetical protein
MWSSEGANSREMGHRKDNRLWLNPQGKMNSGEDRLNRAKTEKRSQLTHERRKSEWNGVEKVEAKRRMNMTIQNRWKSLPISVEIFAQRMDMTIDKSGSGRWRGQWSKI